MPIKFRCEYCRQLMGIAHSKAGTLVDCPTCGRTLRVPNRDGTVDPPPKPAVNLADDGLRRALDELAQLGKSESSDDLPVDDLTPALPHKVDIPAVPAEKAPAPKAVMAPAVQAAPNQQSNAIALEPLPPMKVVDPPSQHRGAVWNLAARGIVPTASPPPEQIAEPKPVPAITAPPAAASPPSNPSRSGLPLPWAIVAMILSLILGGVGGFGLGRYLLPAAPPSPVQKVASPPAVPEPVRSYMKGRLTFWNEQKQLQPDAGACVVILPATSTAPEKLSVVGFRPNDDDDARQAAMEKVAEHGGRLTRSDEEGNYQIEIPEDGEYTVIYLSHFHGRADDDPGSTDALQMLEIYFERPAQLIGQLAFDVASIKHEGPGDLSWDHTFAE